MGPSEQPDFDFMLKFLGENFATFPGVGKLIDVSSPFMTLQIKINRTSDVFLFLEPFLEILRS